MPDHDAFWDRPLEETLAVRPCADEPGVFAADLDGFGGVTLGCAALAAARSCPDRPAHALHAWFLRPVPTQEPARFRVEALRDGRRFAQRRVRVLDAEKVCCEVTVSFGTPGAGPEYQEAELPAGLAGPDGLVSDAADWREETGDETPPGGPLEWRWIGVPWASGEPAPASRYYGWVRPRTPLPDDPGLRVAALALLADYHSHFPVMRKLGGDFNPMGRVTSLDQSVWIHRDLAWDDWWLASSESDVAHGGRALSRRRIHTRDGRLVATMVQEMLLLG